MDMRTSGVAQTVRRSTSLSEGGFVNGVEFDKQGIELKRRQAREGTKVAGLAAEFGKSDHNESLPQLRKKSLVKGRA